MPEIEQGDTKSEAELKELRDLVRQQQHFILRAQDKAIGLERAAVAAQAGASREPLLIELATIRSSASYKIGRVITSPFRLTLRLVRFIERAFRAVARRARAKFQAGRA